MTKAGNTTMHYAINDLSLDWDDSPRRQEKKCSECGMPTTGRMKNIGGIVKPAHMSCAMSFLTNKAMKVYGAR